MKVGLIGKDLKNNFTQYVCKQFGIENYEMVEMSQNELFTLLESKDFDKINITFPYKKDILDYIDVLSDNATRIKAVDTIINKDGVLYGYNTDYDAFKYMMARHDIDFKGKKVLIIGNGGTSAAVQIFAKDFGAKEVVVVDNKESEGAVSYIDCFAQHLNADIVVNTSPVGMSPDIDNAPIDMNLFSHCEALVDLIYNPILTKLGLDAQENGIKRIIGTEMLVAQTKASCEFFTGNHYSEEDVDRIIHQLLVDKCNIVLIGMPSAGKTTIGHMLSEAMGKKFYDMDDVIVYNAKMSVPEIFAKSGEAGFRKLETLAALKLAEQNNIVVATGGGAIKNKINMDYLRLNGIIIFIDRDLDKLISADPNRPLSSSKEALATMFKERYPLYQRYASYIAMNNADINDTVEEIIRAFHKVARDAIA